MRKKLLILLPTILFASCEKIYEPSNSSLTQSGNESNSSSTISNVTEDIIPDASVDENYVESDDTLITLADNQSFISNNNGGVSISENVIYITKDGTYSISGTLTDGQIKVIAGDEDKVYLNLNGVHISCSYGAPIGIYNADKTEISAKSGTENTLIDLRNEEADSKDTSTAALYAACDMELKGKGSLLVETSYNNGVGSKDDLTIKNLTLSVKAVNNAIKGNDSLTIQSGTITAISTQGDALKTENTDISSKGNQRGTVTIEDGTLNLYAACDAIDAAYNIQISGGTINAYTESYSPYSEEVTVTSESLLYLSSSVNQSVRYAAYFEYDDQTNAWIDAKEITSTGGFSRNKVYSFTKKSNAKYVTFYAFSAATSGNSTTDFLYATERLSLPASMDYYQIRTISSSKMSGSWGNYTVSSRPGFGGGMGQQEGNTNKSDYSCKGFKADNEILISDGTITIQSHDDAIHVNNDAVLENQSAPLGNITISGGTLSLYSDDDGIHADNQLTLQSDATITITHSYEGIEGAYIYINGATTTITSSDDAINALTYLEINDGLIYLNADGDGVDSNGNITMNGGIILAQGPSNGGNGVIDYDGKWTFNGGFVLAIGASGMNQKPTAGNLCTSISKTISTTTSSYVTATIDNVVIAVLKVTKSNLNYCVLAFDQSTYGSNYTISVSTTSSYVLTNDLYYIR